MAKFELMMLVAAACLLSPALSKPQPQVLVDGYGYYAAPAAYVAPYSAVSAPLAYTYPYAYTYSYPTYAYY